MTKSPTNGGNEKEGRRARPQLSQPAASYFVSNQKEIQFVHTGCTLLDCVLGGGWAIGRIGNIVGDKSTAKTALATEAMINFMKQYPKGDVLYRETEAAFDKGYAQAMGLDVARVDFAEEKPLLTVEDFAKDLDAYLDVQLECDSPGIYVLDSLDALSDEAEMEAEFGKAGYGMAKAKFLSTMMRQIARKIERSKVLVLIVSQVRENIGVMFGEKYRRSGGKALDHYCSQILWLSAGKSLKKTIKGVERPIGVNITAKCKKNKVGLAFRQCEFDFLFGYGIDDEGASARWLKEVKRPSVWSPEAIASMSDVELSKLEAVLTEQVKEAWAEIETSFLPARSKYAEGRG